MIVANELRIRNLVSFVEDPNRYKDYHEITNINTQKALCHNGDIDTGELFPIPLTPEILEKCGFEKADDGYGGYLSWLYKGGRIRISDKLTWFNGCWTTDVKYLHQLQNLYFALTGEELNINLNK